jgi:hypothetical protein
MAACTTADTCSTGAVAATAQSDQAGRFNLSLAPGGYSVIAVGLFNSLAAQSFTVHPGRSVQLHLSIRNGIE